MTTPANTLAEAFNRLNPRRPVQPEEVPYLFVQRPYSPVADIRVNLQISKRPLKLLFIGHRGAGKSSELAFLSTLVGEQYLPLFIPLYDIFNTPNVNHIDIVFTVLLRLIRRAKEASLLSPGLITSAWEQLMGNIFNPLRNLLFGPEPIPADKETTLTLKLSVLAAELEAKISSESYTRNQVKEKFEGRLTELLEQIKRLSELLEKGTQRRILVIMEDLDKFDTKYVRDLFLDHAQTLNSINTSIIYSFPIGMRYDNSFRAIEQSFDGAFTLPNIGLQHRDGSYDKAGWDTLKGILLRRVEPTLFSEAALDDLLRWSGGHVKTLIQLAQQSIVKTLAQNGTQVQIEHVAEARRKPRDEYMVMLKREQVDLLREIAEDSDKDLVDTTAAKQELLFNGSLLEYGNTLGPWADVNPIVQELLKRDWK